MQMREVEAGYRFRPPKPSRFWQRVLTPIRRRMAKRTYRIREIELRGRDHVRRIITNSRSVMFTVNHAAHGDPFVVLEALDRLAVPCCFLAAWQVFWGWWGLKGWALQKLGAFSIDREGTDVRAFRTAVDVLAEGRRSLVIFPEGDVYHLNDRVTPLREGAAMIALTATRRRQRSGGSPVHVVPCAVKYFYSQDPTPQLESIMEHLERRIHWRPQADRALEERIYRYAEAVLSLKELEYLDAPGQGPLPQRVTHLSEHVLCEMEQRRAGRVSTETVPVRVKQLRHRILQELPGYRGGDDDGPSPRSASDQEASSPSASGLTRDLEDLHLVTQLSSYPGDYVSEKPSIERIAETIDKFEEDALGIEEARPRADRRAVLEFGEPFDVGRFLAEADGSARNAAGPLTATIEQRLQLILDRISLAAPPAAEGRALS